MSEITILTDFRFAKLVGDIRKVIVEGRQRSAQTENQGLVRTYWQIGRRIAQENLTERAAYGESVLFDISREIGMDLRTLQRCVVFYRTYSSLPRHKGLSWSHYRELIQLEDEQERSWYERQAGEESWTRNQLVRSIQQEQYSDTISAEDLDVSAARPKLERPVWSRHMYAAEVLKIIDGSSLILRIDLGFKVSKEQRVRLADLKTEGVEDVSGREAYEYVRRQLTRALSLLVHTEKIDINGRFAAHIFYSFKAVSADSLLEEGRHLNEELLTRGLASPPV